MTALYLADDGVTPIETHSLLKTFKRCPKQTQYKYAERLKKKYLTARDKPLRRGTWFHALLEEHYAGRSWKAKHRELTLEYNLLMDEEKQDLGDLPYEMKALMVSYLWHYGADKDDPYHGWNVLDTEITLECPWPDGSGIYRCRLDTLYETEFGLTIGDHKTNKRLPNQTVRILDNASPLYIWCARENGLDVRAFEWNYIRAKVPSTPQMAYVGTKREGLSTAACDTDYPTFLRAIRAYEAQGMKVSVDDPAVRARLRQLKSVRWEHGKTQTSSFFQRYALEKDDDMIARVVASAMRTRDRSREYDWEDTDTVERAPDMSCDWCDFKALCEAELITGDGSLIRKRMFRTADPMAYYGEIKEPDEGD